MTRRLKKSNRQAITNEKAVTLTTKMRPETTITLNKASFRADEAITGFVDIDLNSAIAGDSDEKLWVVKVELLGYAQMDTQWHDQARNPEHHGKPSYETVPIESCRVRLTNKDNPIYVKPGVSNRVRSLPFRIQLSPAKLIASYNAQKGLFLVDYLLTATARQKCPSTHWNLLKLETRTFVTITPPQAPIPKPLQVTPYSPPLDDMDLFRCPFLQTIRFNYSTHLTPTTLSPSHRMSLYFPLPLYEPDEISLSLTSTLTLRYNQIVNRHTDTTLLPYQTYYRPDTGGEEVLIEFDIPTKVPQTMEFKFAKGEMNLTHSLRVTMHARLFPKDRSKRAKRTWSVDLPVMIRGQHYVETPLSPPNSQTSSPIVEQGPQSDLNSSPQRLWLNEKLQRGEDGNSSDEETVPTSAVSGTSSFGTTATTYSETDETERSGSSSSPRRNVTSPSYEQLRAINLNEVPPQKPAPSGPLPQPPPSSTPSPVLRQRFSPEQMRPATSTSPKSRRKPSPPPVDTNVTKRGAKPRSPSRYRSKSVGASDEARKLSPLIPPFEFSGIKEIALSPLSEPASATSISTKSTFPGTPPSAPAELPSYYHAKPSYYLDQPSPRTANRPRANTAGGTTRAPSSPLVHMFSGQHTTKVKFSDPEVQEDLSVGSYAPPARLPFPRSPPGPDFPFRSISPSPRTTPFKSAIGETLARPNHVRQPSTLASQVTTLSPITARPASKLPSPRPSDVPPSPAITSPSRPGSSSVTHPKPSYPRLSSPLPSPSRIPTHSSTPSEISTSPTVRSRVSVPMSSPHTLNAPSVASHIPIPTPRPPLPSAAKERITSFMTTTTDTTTTTNKSATSYVPPPSTAPTTFSGSTSGSNPRVQLRRRPTKPSLFPPLPPATFAVQREKAGLSPTSPMSPTITEEDEKRMEIEEVKAKIEEKRRTLGSKGYGYL